MANGKIALVTGANRGIGFELAKILLERGDTVIFGMRELSHAENISKQLSKYEDKIHFLEIDVSKDSSVEKAFHQVQSEFSKIDFLINNAGINYDTWHEAFTADLDEAHDTFETNFFGPWRVSKACLPLLKNSENGRIVNVSSEVGSIHSMGGGTPAYSTSKAALNALTKVQSSELKNTNILVNSVCPGWCATEMGGVGGRAPSLGAKSILFALDLPNGSHTGKFFRDGKELKW